VETAFCRNPQLAKAFAPVDGIFGEFQMQDVKKFLLMAVAAAMLASCGTLVGAGTGAAVGAAVGNNTGDGDAQQGAAIGAAAGAVAGTIADPP
jgi:outer membrane lipoprotein SlyB